jgi:hypothetical protein
MYLHYGQTLVSKTVNVILEAGPLRGQDLVSVYHFSVALYLNPPLLA